MQYFREGSLHTGGTEIMMRHRHRSVNRDAQQRRDRNAAQTFYGHRCMLDINTKNQRWWWVNLDEFKPAAQKTPILQWIEIQPAAWWR